MLQGFVMRVELRKIIILLSWVTILLFLQGCVSAAMSGASALYNRRSIEKVANDQYLTLQAYRALSNKTAPLKDANVTVATFNGELLLAGQVPSAWQRSKAEELVRNISGIKSVSNFITIASPSSTLSRINDTWLTAKVKAKLIASEDVDPSHIKVVTENRTVFLMGTVQPEEAEAAVDLARNTDGVGSVVKVFNYLRLSKN